ncbi:hypothetical protein DAY19_05330 [Halobacteriovorax vibrionivorans]|uniref:Pilus assembly protein PilP n=1 Tax=Halobacteriovorax vibrionivorans TaxID=2152716 RepID=A0ABY0IJR8_9BACT|nr:MULTISPECIES: hypothetical protein [Halobacteriovorax]RZF23192.1 hypothetical protein DAY19_05330 [Halobacteriovorax vibrionivorans]TGD46345.1 hypothetical protein EP118_12330 [Halobacteriovorax sp. Y22]
MIKKSLIFFILIFVLSPVVKSQSIDLNTAKNIRDPFKIKYRKKMGHKRTRREKFTGFSNKLSIDNLRIDRLRVTGIFMGKNPRAVVSEVEQGTGSAGNSNGDSVIIREGMKIGPDQVEVKAILPGGVVLVEKIINVYDEEEYLETILPLSD